MKKFHSERYIQQINRGYWTFRVRCKGTDRIFNEKDYLSANACYRAAIDFRNSLVSGSFVYSDNTVDECFYLIEDIFVLRSESMRKYQCIYDKYISNHDKPLKDITRADILSDLNRSVDLCSTDTIQRILAIWRKIIQVGIAKGYIKDDVSVNIKAPVSHRLKPPKRNELTDEQTLVNLSNELKKRLKQPLMRYQAYFILMTLFYTGLRPAELFALEINDVDLRKKVIHVNKELEASRRRSDAIRPCKTELSHRDVPIPEKLVQILKDYEPNCDIYFGIKGKHYSVSQIGDSYHTIAKKIGIDFHLYQCRHTYITNLYLNGVDLKTLMELCGQNVESTTIGYVVSSEQRKRSAVSLFDTGLAQSNEKP